MTTRIVGVFAAPDQAQHAVQGLIDQGVPQGQISAIMPAPEHDQQPNAAEAGGAAIGSAALAGLGLASLAIIGIGPLIAAGPFAAALTVGASANAKHAEALSQIEEGLARSGLTRDQARSYAQRLSEGNSIVAVDVPDDQMNVIADLFHRSGGMGLDFRPLDREELGSAPPAGDE